MTDILTPTKGLAQQTVGSNDDEWGDVLNDTIKLIDSALGGTLDRILTGDVTLTTTEIQSTGYHFRGTLLGATTVIFPTYFGLAVIRNSADKPVACGMAGGRFVTIPPHGCSAIWSDGTDFTDVNQFLTVGGGLHGVDAVAGSGAEGGNLVSVAGAGDGNGTGGWASLAGGMGGNTAVGGGAELAGGNGGTIGGDATVRGGDAIQNGNGGHVWITSGKGKGAGHTAGNVILTTYKSEGGATPGDLRLDLGGGFFITGLPTTDPGRAGTFWLSNGVLIQSGKTLGNAVSSSGLSFGSTFAASSTDLSKHLALYGTTYGLNVTSGRINYVAPTAAGHAFLVGSTAVTTVAPSGNLLIGTTTDGVYRLDVQSAGGSTRMARFSANPTVSAIGPPIFNNGVYILGADASQTAVAVTMDAFGTSPIFCGRRINGTAAVPTPLADNDLITGILAQGVSLVGSTPVSAGGVTPHYSIQAEGAWTQTSYGLRHVWRTIASGLTSSSEKMRLTASGNLLIGTTTDGTQKLDVAGNARVTGTFNVVGDIQQLGNILTLGNASISGTLNVGGLSIGSLATVQATKTGTAYTVANNDASLILNPSGTFTLTLPAASALSGRIILLKLIAAFAVNSATANVVPLAGGAASTAILPATAGKYVMLQSDGTNWQIMMAN